MYIPQYPGKTHEDGSEKLPRFEVCPATVTSNGRFTPWPTGSTTTTEVVVALAPVDGALHEFNTLDTLGFDAPEFQCGR